jgi:putative Mg2+ transporter-C (MgtC) family protein
VHGLATAAYIQVSAALGVTAALAVWPLIVGGLSLAMLLLFVGAPLEPRTRERTRLSPSEVNPRDAKSQP